MMGGEASPDQVVKRRGGKPEWFRGEHPQHRVTITKRFYMGTYEVTVGEFRQFVNRSGYKTDAEKADGACVWSRWSGLFVKKGDANWRNPYFKQEDSQPVVCVSWNDGVEFCRWLSENEQITYRLPAEAEWEYACRAGTTTAFYYGDSLSRKQANFSVLANSGKTVRAGSFRPNAWGLYDMHGNVLEWCSDWYGENYYSSSPVNDPKGPGSGEYRVIRGGCYYHFGRFCRSAFRTCEGPTNRFNILGFRVVQTPQD